MSAEAKTFVWSGLDAQGNRVKNKKILARSEAEAVSSLRTQGFLATKMNESAAAGMNITIGPEGVKFKYAARAEFARRMHQMMRAGISIPQALAAIGEDAKPAVRDMCVDMAEVVASGKAFSTALARHPRAFDDVFVAYVRAGEDTDLIDSMGRLSVLLAKRAAMQAKIKGVMAYPKMVGGVMLVLVFGIITFLVPTYAKIYDSFNAKLPAPTRALVWASEHMLPVEFNGWDGLGLTIPIPVPQPFNLMTIISVLLAGWIFFKKKTKDNLEIGRRLDIIKFRMPVLGSLWHMSSLFQWASTLAGALGSGVAWERALGLAAASSGSRWQLIVAQELQESVRSGRPISKTLRDHEKLYPPSIRTMIATGEETGDVDEMLAASAQTLDEDVASLVEGLSAKIEVALLVLLGVVVGGLLVILYMPILQLATTASKGLGVT
jgi:type IV pilus assembly protein PilC